MVLYKLEFNKREVFNRIYGEGNIEEIEEFKEKF